MFLASTMSTAELSLIWPLKDGPRAQHGWKEEALVGAEGQKRKASGI